MGSSLRELTARAAARESPDYRAGFEAAWDVAHELLTSAPRDVIDLGADTLAGSLELVHPRTIAQHAASELRTVVDLLRRAEDAAHRGGLSDSLAWAFGDAATQIGLIADAIVHLVDVYLEADPPWVEPGENAERSTPLVRWLVNYTISGSIAGRDPDRLAGDIVEAVGRRPQMIDLVRAHLVSLDGLDDLTGDRNRQVIHDLEELSRREGT